jgi:hypothetical protein
MEGSLAGSGDIPTLRMHEREMMFTHQGIAVDSWARVEDGCRLRCEVVGDEAQFEFGERVASLSLIFSERGLEKMIGAATQALDTLRAGNP